jgi:hypothetical protein
VDDSRGAFDASTKTYRVAYRDTGIDLGVSYPPFKEHTLWHRKVEEQLMH